MLFFAALTVYFWVGGFLFTYTEYTHCTTPVPVHERSATHNLTMICLELKKDNFCTISNMTIGLYDFNPMNRSNEQNRTDCIDPKYKPLCLEVLAKYERLRNLPCGFNFDRVYYWSYFSWITCTTVGYGDITLHSSAGKLLLIPFTLIGIPLNYAFLGISGAVLKTWILNLIQFIEKRVFKRADVSGERTKVLIGTISVIIVCLLVNAMTYRFYTKLDFVTSLYFYYITLTTIGYGDYTMAQIDTGENSSVVIVTIFVLVPFFWLGMISLSSFLQALSDSIHVTKECCLFCACFARETGRIDRKLTLTSAQQYKRRASVIRENQYGDLSRRKSRIREEDYSDFSRKKSSATEGQIIPFTDFDTNKNPSFTEEQTDRQTDLRKKKSSLKEEGKENTEKKKKGSVTFNL